jgi:hypothetical protein
LPTVPRASRRTPVRRGGHKARSITTLSHQREVSWPEMPATGAGSREPSLMNVAQ